MKIKFQGLSRIDEPTLARHHAYAMGLGLPMVGEIQPVAERLAIVGGGLSVAEHIDELRRFPGEVWAINGTFHWCRAQGIFPSFYTIDPSPKIEGMCLGAEHAILSTRCDPSVFRALKGKQIELTHVGPGGLEGGATSAATAPIVAITRGHRHVMFFGCESSYGQQSHIYENKSPSSLIDVVCGGHHYVTSPDMFMQAELLCDVIKTAPLVFDEHSGGLLGAMVRHDWDIVAASKSIHTQLGLA